MEHEKSKKRKTRAGKKKNRRFEPNLDTIMSGLRNPTGELPKDFFTNPRKYRLEEG